MSADGFSGMSLGYLGIGAGDLAAWREFGRDVLGAGVVDDGDRVLLRTDDLHHRVAVAAGADRLDYAGWEVVDAAELDGHRRMLEQAGVAVRGPEAEELAARRVQDLISFEDPSGVRHELFWGRQVSVADPFRSPTGVSRFVDGIGHYVFLTDAALETRDFFVRLLGFRLTDFRSGAWFLSCNHRHHNVAVVQSGENRMHHFMLETGELDDVGRALDRAQHRGCQSRAIGRHSNDLTVSFYLWTPSGFELEYGWDSVVLGQGAHPVREIDSGDTWGHGVLGAGSP